MSGRNVTESSKTVMVLPRVDQVHLSLIDKKTSSNTTTAVIMVASMNTKPKYWPRILNIFCCNLRYRSFAS